MTIEPQAAASGGPWQDWEHDVIDGRFPLRQWIGSSDHSQVFLTEQRLEKAAIKLLPVDLVDATSQLSRWRAAMALEQPHLIRILDCGQCQIHGREYLFVVTEYADETLAEILPIRALNAEEVSSLIEPLLDAIAGLHERRWLHTRIQPSNIMVVGDQVKLSRDNAVPLQAQPLQARTSLYDPPDPASRHTPAADIWALGITLIESLTQHVPLPSAGGELSALPEDLPPALSDLIRRCLQQDPSRRPAAGALWAEITGGVRSAPAIPVAETRASAGVAPLAQLPPAPRPAPRAEPATTAAAPARSLGRVAAVGAIVALAAWLLMHRHAPQAPSPAPVAAAVPDVPTPAASVVATEVPTAKPAPASPVSPASQAGGTGVRHEELPRVPEHAAATIRGRFNVVVRVTVDPNGDVSDSRFESAGPSAYFGRLSLNAARHWTFVRATDPAREWTITFQYSRDGVTAHAQAATR